MYRLISGFLILVGTFASACGGGDDDGAPAATENATGGPTTITSAAAGTGTGKVFSSSQLPIPVTVTAPATWEQPSDANGPDLFAVATSDAPGGYIDFLEPRQVYNRPTATERQLADPPADYVGWLNDYPFLQIVATRDVTVGKLPGKRLEITNNDNDTVPIFKLSDGTDYGIPYRDHLYVHILNGSGAQILVACGSINSLNFDQFKDTCSEVLKTAQFGGR